MMRNNNIPILLYLAGLLSFLVLSCNISEVENAGNSTQTGNGYVLAGSFFKPDGTTPAVDALVEVRKKEALASISSGLNKKATDASHMTVTNNKGCYSFSALEQGVYVVVGVDENNNMGLVDSVTIPASDSSLNLGDDTLLPPGTLIGSVVLPNGGFPEQVFILAFGLDRFSNVHADETFHITSLPAGTYTFRFLSLDPQYGYIDIENIRIGSDSTTSLGSITLPVRELDIPELTVYYDTLGMKTTLSWTRVPGCAGYNIYRITSDSVYNPNSLLGPSLGFSELHHKFDTFKYPLNGKTLYQDTTFTDSMINGYKLPEGTYYIAAVDALGNEWEMSEPARVPYYSPFRIVDTVYLENFPYDHTTRLTSLRIFVTAEDMFLFDGIAADSTYCFSIYTENGTQVAKNNIAEIPGQEKIKLLEPPFDSNGNYYFARVKADSVLLQTFTSGGEMGEIMPIISSDSQIAELPSYFRMGIVNDLVLISGIDSLVLGHFDIQSEEYVSWKDWNDNDSALFFEKYGTFPEKKYPISEHLQLTNDLWSKLISDSLAFTQSRSGRTYYHRYTESGTVETGRVLPNFGNRVNFLHDNSVAMFVPAGLFLKYAFVD